MSAEKLLFFRDGFPSQCHIPALRVQYYKVQYYMIPSSYNVGLQMDFFPHDPRGTPWVFRCTIYPPPSHLKHLAEEEKKKKFSSSTHLIFGIHETSQRSMDHGSVLITHLFLLKFEVHQ